MEMMMGDLEPAWVTTLVERAAIYRQKQGERDFGAPPEYNRFEVEMLKAEAVEMALYEARQAMGLPAEAPDWM